MAEQDVQNTDTQPEEPEGFTGLDPNSLPEELKSIYKNMQADYTRKTQQLAEQRKQFESKETEWENKLKTYGAVEHEVQQWRDWYSSLLDTEGQPKQPAATGQQSLRADAPMKTGVDYTAEPDASNIQEYVKTIASKYEQELSSLKGEITNLHSALKDTTKQTSRMLSYQTQLNDLSSKYQDLDKKALLDYAIKAGQTDLERAYKEMNHDNLVEKEVQSRLKTEMDKLRTQGIRGPGQKVIIRKNENAPKSFAEASEAILRDHFASSIGVA